MRTYLVLEGAEALAEPGNEFRVLSGEVMTERGLSAWAQRRLGTPDGASFLTIADAARSAGVALFALPTRDVRRADPDTSAVEVTVGGRTVLLLRRKSDPTGPARLRWQGEDGGSRETEVPGFVADALAKGPGGPAVASEPADPAAGPNGGTDATASPGALPGDAPRKSRKRKGQDSS